LPRVIATAVVPSRGLRHGYITNRDEAVAALRRALDEAEKESGEHIRYASLSIGGIGLGADYAMGTSIVTKADSIISKLDIDNAIADAENKLDLKNKSILHAFPVVFKVDGVELPARPEGINGLRLEVKTLFITCLSQHLDDLLSVAADAGVKVTSFTASPIATEKLLLTDLQRNYGCALIDIGAETVSVAVYENSTLTSLHVFGIGSNDITKDIALGLRITPEEAENIKIGVVSFQSVPKKKLDEIVEARLSDIFELIDKYFKKIGRSGLLPAGAIIIGGGSHLQQIESVAKTMLKIPVRIGYTELPGTKGIVKDSRILLAYSLATSTILSSGGSSSSSNRASHSSGEGFMDTIKAFFKQLMP
jgi:cell division protein FtsA